MLIDGEKYACEACIRGHRVSNCEHKDRPLTKIAKKGRPVSQCSHCRGLRKSRSTHTACECGAKPHAKAQCINGVRSATQTETTSCCCTHGQRCSCALKKEPLDSVTESPYDGAIATFGAALRPLETGIQPMINSLNSPMFSGSSTSVRNPSAYPVQGTVNNLYHGRSRRPSSRPRSRDHTPMHSQTRSRAMSDSKTPARESRWSGSSTQSQLTKSPSHASITTRHLAPLDLSSFTPSNTAFPTMPQVNSQPTPLPRLQVDAISASTMSSDNFNFLSSPDNDSAVNSAVDMQSNWSFPDAFSSASSVTNMSSVPGSGIFGYQKPWHVPRYAQTSNPSPTTYDEPSVGVTQQIPSSMPERVFEFPPRPYSGRPPSHHSWTVPSARSSASFAPRTYSTVSAHSDVDLSRIHRDSSYSLPTYTEEYEYPHSTASLISSKQDLSMAPPMPPMPSVPPMPPMPPEPIAPVAPAEDAFDLPIQMPMDDVWAATGTSTNLSLMVEEPEPLSMPMQHSLPIHLAVQHHQQGLAVHR